MNRLSPPPPPALRRFAWALARSREMSALEIPFRLREQWRRQLDRFMAAPGAPLAIKTRPPPAFPIDAADLEAAIGSTARAALLVEVDRLLESGFELLGVSRPPAMRTEWALDPATGLRWPEVYCHDIDFRGLKGHQDIKPAWELSRLQHLQLLAMASFLEDHRGAREACLVDLSKWFADNPPYRGIGYSAGVEVACRVVSLLVIAALVEIPAELWPIWWDTLAAHGHWLERYPSLHSSANNHRIAELCALVCLGALAPELPRASRWLDAATNGLFECLPRQIAPDGVGTEHSLSYQAWTMEWVLVARRATAATGGLGPRIDALLAAGAGFLSAMTDARGNSPAIGDDDGTVVIRQTLGPERTVQSVAGATAAILDRPELCPRSWRPDLRAGLLGARPTVPAYQPRSRTFSSGYSVLRGTVAGDEWLVYFDHGPLGFPMLAAHGHADALAVWLHVQGRPILVDSGTFRYAGNPDWRRYLRSSLAHNTITLDRVSQSEPAGAFLWGRRANARAVEVRLGREGGEILAEHDGYLRRFDVLTRRRVALGSDELAIHDAIEGRGLRTVCIAFHFAPDLDLVERMGEWQVRGGGSAPLTLTPPEGLVGRVARQVEAPGPGAHSPAYGRMLAAPSLVFEGGVDLPFSATTRIRRSNSAKA